MKELFYCSVLFTLFTIAIGTQPPTIGQSREIVSRPATSASLQALRDQFVKNDSLLEKKKALYHIEGVINKKALDTLKNEIKNKVTQAAKPVIL